MKMTLIDWTIVFAVSNVVFSGFFIKHEEPYAPPPICRMNPDGTLVYSFVESVKGSSPFGAIRWLGGVLFLVGMLIMAYNMFTTMAGGKVQDAPVIAPAAHHA